MLTHKAMNGETDLSQVYGKRLQAIRPTRGRAQGDRRPLYADVVPDVQAVFDALRFLNKTVFIISGGLAEPVRGFGKRLGVPLENIRAVELEYDELSGEWWRYDEAADAQRAAVHGSRQRAADGEQWQTADHP
ncbi:MAG: hypothetical protein HND48_01915 [Chloroflexi bacterium]|nr:hypothetical protein [Chloroflexota bacterium]